jgi:ribokinase
VATPALTVVGSVNLDLVARCERLPRPGETVSDATFLRVPGGKGANQAAAAAKLGADVRLVARVGRDHFADEAVRPLEGVGVDLSAVRTVDGPTGVALILVDEAGENQIVVAPGANATVEPADVRVEGADAVLCQLEVPVAAVVAAAERAPRLFALNAAPAKPVPVSVIERADLVVVNRYEREALPSEPRLLAVTLGAEGAVLYEEGREVARAQPPRVEAVDGTAAGDAFCAALVVSIVEGRPHEEALARACAAGAIAASRLGAQPSLPDAHEIELLLAR